MAKIPNPKSQIPRKCQRNKPQSWRAFWCFLFRALSLSLGFGICDLGFRAVSEEAPDAGASKGPSSGLTTDYFLGDNFQTHKGTFTDPTIALDGTGKAAVERLGVKPGPFSVRWTGQFKSESDDEYTFQVVCEGGVRLWIAGALVVDDWKARDRRKVLGKAKLQSGKWYDIQMDYRAAGSHPSVQLLCSAAPSPQPSPPGGEGRERGGEGFSLVPEAQLKPGRLIREPFPEPYAAPPDFLDKLGYVYGRTGPEELKGKMDLSFEPVFYTECDLSGYSKPEPRSAALVKAALAKEEQGEFREALEIYQKVIAEHDEDLHRVSKFGVFVPVVQYCQRRILQFPWRDLAFYRTKYDARAQEAFEQAWRKNSLEGLADVADSMLATSYGGRAMLALGDSAFDRGHYLEALEYYRTVREAFSTRDRRLHTAELALKIAYCQKVLGDKTTSTNGEDAPLTLPSPQVGRGWGEGELPANQRALLEQAVAKAAPLTLPSPQGGEGWGEGASRSQLSSPPYASADDFTLMPPTKDPLGIAPAVWEHVLPGSREDCYACTHPVVTGNSVIYRHKNIVYCRSLLTGQLRWKNDLGGRVSWQNWDERQYPQEDVLVQDGLVFAPLQKVGPTLVAMDEVTGQLRWAYGPMVASTKEEAQMRFECAPSGGPRTVYASYVLDNIEGDCHIDSEYGVIAFESTTGRISWRQPVCRLRPGLFSAQFAMKRRNRILSFTSPPLYHEGTVYCCTNAGAMAALDALSGRVRWVMRYPYYALPYSVHDATRKFGAGGGAVEYTRVRAYPHSPMFWYNQRPLLNGERLYLTPVDSPFLLCIERRTGRILWTKPKGEGIKAHRTDGGPAYLVGAARTGELVLAYSFREYNQDWAGPHVGGGVHLVDPDTGKTVWESGDLVEKRTQPVLKYNYGDNNIGFWGFGANGWPYMTTARPFFTGDNQVCVTGYFYHGYPFYTWASNLAVVDLTQRQIVGHRNYLDGVWMRICDNAIRHAHERIKLLEEVPHKTDRINEEIRWLQEIKEDSVPENPHGPFLPFSRVTKQAYGTMFELRTSPRTIAMVFDREAVKKAVADRSDPEGLFARAELGVGDSRLDEAAGLMNRCLAALPSEGVDFRAAVNQQLYQVHKLLARSGVQSGNVEKELAHCVGMWQTVCSCSDEIETLLALAEAHEEKGDLPTAARLLRSVVERYGHYEFPAPSLLSGNLQQLASASEAIFDRGRDYARNTMYGKPLTEAVSLMQKGMPVYFSSLSPLAKDLTLRAGDLAAARLLRLQKNSAPFAAEFEKEAKAALALRTAGVSPARTEAGETPAVRSGGGASPDEKEKLFRLREYPGTKASQEVLNQLLQATAPLTLPSPQGGEGGVRGGGLAEKAEARKRLWQLADAARVCELAVPEAFRDRVLAPAPPGPAAPLVPPLAKRQDDLADAQGTAWLVLERRGDLAVRPELVFLGGRVRKKTDTRFVLTCMEMGSGKVLWKAKEKRGETLFEDLRLGEKGNEPGFFEAFVRADAVIVHGLFDVLAFNLADGMLRWRYRVPFDFEIAHAASSGDLLVLVGSAETLALYALTEDPRGEVVWQEKEQGDNYVSPWFAGDRLVSLRKMPFNVTVRYRSTGKLVGRLALPDLLLTQAHPLVDKGQEELPVSSDGDLLALSDGWYYILVDLGRMKIAWKRLIDQNDPTREPPMRLALKGEYLAVIKQDFDVKTIYMLSSRTGEVLWHTDPKVPGSPEPVHSILIEGDRLYGIKPHAGQGFYFSGMDCKTGRNLFAPAEEKGYQSRPLVGLLGESYGGFFVARIQCGQDFELKVFDAKTGSLVQKAAVKGAGSFGEHGQASASVQNGGLVLLGKNELLTWTAARK